MAPGRHMRVFSLKYTTYVLPKNMFPVIARSSETNLSTFDVEVHMSVVSPLSSADLTKF